MLIEEWRQILSFPAYEASSFGGIRSRFRVLQQQYNDDGYKTVSVYKGGKGFTKRVHWLVCEAFHGVKPAWAAHAAHNSGKKTNNRPGNLRWSTALSNAADTLKHGTRYQGEDHWAASFTESQVLTVRAQYAAAPTPDTIKRLAEAFDVPRQTIRNIVKNRTWKHVKPRGRRA